MEVINIEKDTELVISSQANDIQININNCRAIITDISCSSKTINIVNGELEYSYIKGLAHEGKNIITTENGKCVIRVIDLESNNGSEIYNLITKGYKDEIDFSVACISKKNVNKDYFIRSENITGDTGVKIDCFGIVEDTSKLKYDITSYIKQGAKRSVVNQNSKILLFDKESVGINNPILEIEENDVKANHGSSIGMIDEETLFYLTSRGIEESVARNLVSMGKISYMIEKINDKKIREKLLERM